MKELERHRKGFLRRLAGRGRMRVFGKAVGITALAFLLSSVLMAPFSVSTSALFATPEKNDFTMPDFYNMVADSRAVSRLDDNVVIVNIDRSDRAEIADILNVAALSGAAAVGLDAVFEDEREGDGPLLEALGGCPGLVQPLSLEHGDSAGVFEVKTASWFYGSELDGGWRYAAANLPSRYAHSMIREMQLGFPMGGTDTVPGLAVAVAAIKSPGSVAKLRARGENLPTINYHSRRFRVIEPENLIERADELTGRVVLLGAMNERGDMHITPVNSAMPGVLVHAHAAATILDGDYINKLPQWINVVAACLLCLAIVFTTLSFDGAMKGLLMRLLQLTLLYATVQVGYWAFVTHNLIIDFSYSLLMLTFGLFAIDIWNGFAHVGKKAVHGVKWLNNKWLRPRAERAES